MNDNKEEDMIIRMAEKYSPNIYTLPTVLAKKKDMIVEMTEKYSPNIYNALPVVLARGRGVYVWDIGGRRYFDCLAGYSSMNQGHRHPRIVKAAKD